MVAVVVVVIVLVVVVVAVIVVVVVVVIVIVDVAIAVVVDFLIWREERKIYHQNYNINAMSFMEITTSSLLREYILPRGKSPQHLAYEISDFL